MPARTKAYEVHLSIQASWVSGSHRCQWPNNSGRVTTTFNYRVEALQVTKVVQDRGPMHFRLLREGIYMAGLLERNAGQTSSSTRHSISGTAS